VAALVRVLAAFVFLADAGTNTTAALTSAKERREPPTDPTDQTDHRGPRYRLRAVELTTLVAEPSGFLTSSQRDAKPERLLSGTTQAHRITFVNAEPFVRAASTHAANSVSWLMPHPRSRDDRDADPRG
jgi:hypothetical protein